MNATAVLLAAGFGTRMKSALPKALHPIAGRPMLRHLVGACEAAFDRIAVVVGPGMEAGGACGGAAPQRRAGRPARHRPRRLAGRPPVRRGRRGGAQRRQPADPPGHAAPPACRPCGCRPGAAGHAPRRPGALRPASSSRTARWSASSNTLTPAPPSAASACATPAAWAPPPPTWRAGCAQSGPTTPPASTTCRTSSPWPGPRARASRRSKRTRRSCAA